jgi:hypothetical protein
MRYLTAIILVALASPAVAQHVPVPIASDAELKGQSADGAAIEVRVDGDLNGDGETDTAFIERGDDVRKLHVLIAYRSDVDLGHDPLDDELQLDSAPLGPAELTIKNGILVVHDLTGGTSATDAIYRFRYDPKVKKMRLIGLDATDYSRTFQTDSYAISWNLLTGDFITRYSKLKPASAKGDQAYENAVERRSKKPSKPLYLGTTPDPSSTISAENWPRG